MVVPPAQLVLDTSFVVEALIATQPRHSECDAFLAYVTQAGSRVHFNRLLELELWEATYRIALKGLHSGKRAKNVGLEGPALRRAKGLREEVETAWRDVLVLIDSATVDLGEVVAWVPQMMACGVSSYDAVHAATAIYVGSDRSSRSTITSASFRRRRSSSWFRATGCTRAATGAGRVS